METDVAAKTATTDFFRERNYSIQMHLGDLKIFSYYY
jgi:hypothetical protein